MDCKRTFHFLGTHTCPNGSIFFPGLLMLTKWIVVADSTRARIFANRHEDESIEEITDLANPSGRSNDSELASYTPGEGARPGPRTATQEDSASDHTAELFSKNVAQYL